MNDDDPLPLQDPCGKRRYAHKRDALTMANHRTRGRGKRHGRVRKLRAYPCPVCNGWHLTKQT